MSLVEHDGPDAAGQTPTDRMVIRPARTADPTPTSARRLLMVWAHPDDEAYLAAGLAGRVVDAGGSVRCITLTHGEAGFPVDDPRRPGERRAHRARELRTSLAALGVDDFEVLGFDDGSCAATPVGVGASHVLSELRRFEPDLVVTFEPSGVTGHPDHKAASLWTTAAWRQTPSSTLLYAVHTTSYVAEFGRMNEELGVYMGTSRPVGTPDHEVSLDLHLSPEEIERKRTALAGHASQTTGIAAVLGESRYRRWWRRETFRLPRPDEVSAVRTRAGQIEANGYRRTR